jgi:hypothetical protein
MTATPPRPDLYPLDTTRDARALWALDNTTIPNVVPGFTFRECLVPYLIEVYDRHSQPPAADAPPTLCWTPAAAFATDLADAKMIPTLVDPDTGKTNPASGPELEAFMRRAIRALALKPASAPRTKKPKPDPYRVCALTLAVQLAEHTRNLGTTSLIQLVQAYADAFEQDLRDETTGGTE